MAGLDGALARPDVPVFPPVAEVRLGLHRPFPDVADSRPDVVCWSGAGRGAVRQVCLDTVGASPERLRDRMAAGAEKLAVRGPRPADAVPDRPASVWFLLRPAWNVPAERWALSHVAAAALYKPDAAPFAA